MCLHANKDPLDLGYNVDVVDNYDYLDFFIHTNNRPKRMSSLLCNSISGAS